MSLSYKNIIDKKLASSDLGPQVEVLLALSHKALVWSYGSIEQIKISSFAKQSYPIHWHNNWISLGVINATGTERAACILEFNFKMQRR